jgi:hypothetical protein
MKIGTKNRRKKHIIGAYRGYNERFIAATKISFNFNVVLKIVE